MHRLAGSAVVAMACVLAGLLKCRNEANRLFVDPRFNSADAESAASDAHGLADAHVYANLCY
jgi:hypothetical protein